MTETHPILTYFRETKQASFPLVLAVGREANTDLQMENRDGAYDFRLFPHASFWNNAYGILAESVGLECWRLKDICTKSECSPLVVGNCLPIGIKNDVRNKRAVRMRVSEDAKRDHVQAMFSLRVLVDRVGMVVMSGVDDAVFDASREVVVSECRRRGVQAAEVPFFYGGNRPAIERKLTTEDWAKIKEITSAFLAYCESKGKHGPTRGLKWTATHPR